MIPMIILIVFYLSSKSTEVKAQLTDINVFDPSEFDCQHCHRIMFHYFRNKHYISLIDLSQDGFFGALKFVESDVTRPVIIFNSWETFNLKIEPELTLSSVVGYPTAGGIYIKCKKEFVLNDFLQIIAKANPVKKLMFQFEEQTFESAKEVLKIGFEKYKILNVAVLVIDKHHQSSTPQSSMCLYNPFSFQSPDFQCINFTTARFNEQLSDMEKFIRARVTNLQKYQLKIEIFPYPLVSKPVIDGNSKVLRYSYVDGANIDIIAKVMNFTPVYLEPSLSPTYGYRFPNGTLTGSLAALEHDKADFVANARLITDYPTTKAIFLQATTTARYKFIMHKQKRRRELMLHLTWEFDTKAQVICVIASCSFPLLYYLTRVVDAMISRRRKHDSFIKCFLYSVALSYNISMPKPKRTSSRIVFLVAVFYSLIITSIYQGTIIKNLNSNRNFESVKTIDELIDRGYKPVMTHTLNNIFNKQSGDRVNEKLKRLSSESEGVMAKDGIQTLLHNKDVAFLWSDIYTTNFLDRFYDEKSGENLFEVVPETAFEFYIAPMAPKSSPFLESFNEIILRFVEGGLNIYHFGEAKAENEGIWFDRVKRGLIPKGTSTGLTCSDMEMLFKLILMMFVISFIVFLLEITIQYFRKRPTLRVLCCQNC